MTTASQFSGQTLTPSQLVHYNALLGLASWSEWSELVFQQNNLLTWYRSPIRDMLFNSVVAASLEEDDFRTAFREVVDYSERGRCPIAWLVAEPKLLSELHRSLFREYGFDERRGTTAMYRSLSAADETHPPKPGDDGRRVEVVQDDEQLRTWAKLIFASYGFPAYCMEPWWELHRSIGYLNTPLSDWKDPAGEKTASRPVWQHFLLREGNEYIGTSSLYWGHGAHHASLANLSVLPTARGKGGGALLVQDNLALLQNAHYETVTLYSSESARKLYTRLGFQGCQQTVFFLREVG